MPQKYFLLSTEGEYNQPAPGAVNNNKKHGKKTGCLLPTNTVKDEQNT
jgi:hypothetical protein